MVFQSYIAINHSVASNTPTSCMNNKELKIRARTPHPSEGRHRRFENLTATLPSTARKIELQVGCFVIVTPGEILKFPQSKMQCCQRKRKIGLSGKRSKYVKISLNHLLQPSFEWQWLLARNLEVAPCRKSHLSQVVAWSSNVLQESFSQASRHLQPFHCINTTCCAVDFLLYII